jgi:Cu(I)/Ag(I) efflux system periplasmic protein CusF
MRKTTGAVVAALAIAAAANGFTAVAAPAAVESRVIVAQADKPSGQGTVNSIDAAAGKINMTHGPVAALKWPGMTMDFIVAPGVDIGALKPGAKVGFTLMRGADGMYAIDSIKPE